MYRHLEYERIIKTTDDLSLCGAACSSSMVALHDAVTDLAMGRIDYAMVGGGQTVLSPAVSLAFNRLQMLSPEAACKSFDASGNGYARADGVSVNPTNTNKVRW